MAVFSMATDRHFVRTWGQNSVVDVFVYEYAGPDPYEPEMIRTRDPTRWRGGAIKVGPSVDAKYKSLEVHGVTIQGPKLTQLAKELTLTSPDGQLFHLAVNRQGYCFLYVNSTTPNNIMRLRINDYFGWSKYGVKLNQGQTWTSIWNKCDMDSLATVVDVAAMKKKEEEMVDLLKEKEKEVAANRDLVEKSKELECVWKKLLDNKDKQLLLLKNAMSALVDRL
ncbi:hypothetical protein LINPERPRIM_LOCUS16106 [Linum perenne]